MAIHYWYCVCLVTKYCVRNVNVWQAVISTCVDCVTGDVIDYSDDEVFIHCEGHSFPDPTTILEVFTLLWQLNAIPFVADNPYFLFCSFVILVFELHSTIVAILHFQTPIHSDPVYSTSILLADLLETCDYSIHFSISPDPLWPWLTVGYITGWNTLTWLTIHFILSILLFILIYWWHLKLWLLSILLTVILLVLSYSHFILPFV